MKKLLTAILLLSQISVFSQFKLACVGNSITSGRGLTDPSTESYPAQIKSMLGNNWTVINCGHSGATVFNKSTIAYVNQSEYTSALNFKPNVVVIKLGTNDSKTEFWSTLKADFVSDYKALIQSFKNLSSKPIIFVCYPIPALASNYHITNSVLVNEIDPFIKSIASAMNITVIDLYTPFLNHSEWYQSDLIHTTAMGDTKLAEFISSDLLKNGIINPRLTTSTDTIKLSAAKNSTVSFTISSNISWQLNWDQEWLNPDKSSISNNDSITYLDNSIIKINADANYTSKNRIGTITITGKGITKKIIIINQQANNTNEVSTFYLDDYRIYPNPAQNIFYMSGIKSTNAMISMYDNVGKLVLSKHIVDKVPLGTNTLPEGLYSIIVADNYSTVNKKLIIKK